MREAFERAILERPDEIAGYAAYADWLQEQNDPRGEFIAVQLALEDESRPASERKKLQEREAELLKAHERELLGELGPFLHAEDKDAKTATRIAPRWRRGFLRELTVGRLSCALAQTLGTATACRFVRELAIHNTLSGRFGGLHPNEPKPCVPTPPRMHHHHEYFELIGSPFLQQLRVFRMGNVEPPEAGCCDSHCYAEGLEHLIATMPRLEELHLLCRDYDVGKLFALSNLTTLRVLRAYHIEEHPLEILAANPAFANLTHLQFHPHSAREPDELGYKMSYLPLEQVQELVRAPYLKSLTHLQLRLSDMGDDGVREIIDSGILKRLKWLDLRHGCITDDGAKLFAKCPDAKNLECLDLSRNAVSVTGLNRLRTAGVKAVANRPLIRGELDEQIFLGEGDYE
jgi:uncharacterized protein (TIGR02996 family)